MFWIEEQSINSAVKRAKKIEMETKKPNQEKIKRYIFLITYKKECESSKAALF